MKLQFSLDLISANNGWAMAATGAIIVMLGLATLSVIISQLHKIVALFEPKPAEPQAPPKTPTKAAAEENLLSDTAAAAKFYKAISEPLGDSFPLSQLYALCQKENLPHVHITVRSLRSDGFLTPTGNDDLYGWQNC
jgi:hypothetical protein